MTPLDGYPEWFNTVSFGDVLSLVVWLVSAVVVLVKGGPVARRLNRFADVLFGTPPDPALGTKGTPGMAARLVAVEEVAQQALEAAQDAAFHSKPNHGTSSHDAVMRELGALRALVQAMGKQVSAHDQALSFLSADEPEPDAPAPAHAEPDKVSA